MIFISTFSMFSPCKTHTLTMAKQLNGIMSIEMGARIDNMVVLTPTTITIQITIQIKSNGERRTISSFS